MQCTPEQIELKRKLALEKLQARKQQKLNHSTNSPNSVNYIQISNNNTKNYSVSSPSSNNLYSPSIARTNKLNTNTLHEDRNGSNLFNQSHTSNLNQTNFNNKNRYVSKTHANKTPQQFYGKTISGTCYMVSETRFEVNLSGYHAKAIEIFKTIPSRAYDIKTKLWSFNLNDYQSVLSKLSVLNPEVVVGKIPPYVVNLCQQKKVDYSGIDISKIDPELYSTLMSFQQEGVCFGISNNGRCLIADDMGLGKTFQALGIAHYYKEDWPLLIVTTSSMRNEWQDRIHKYLPSVPSMWTQYMATTRDFINECKILITSHDMMTRSVDKLLEKKFGVIVIDESHVIKNFKAKCTKSAIALAKKAKRVILLSGTPALSRPNELYSQLSLIDHKFFGDFFEYSRRYCDGKSTTYGWDSSGKSNLSELEVVLMKKFMIRRTKNDVQQLLPSKTREIVKLDVALEQLTEVERHCLSLLTETYLTKKQDKHSALLALFSESAKIKIPSVCTYMLQLLEENKKFLIFAHHQVMLNAICKVLDKNKKKFIRIDGTTTPDQRKYFVDKFQLNNDYVCAVLSITAANAGITLTAAQIVLFAELHWNPSIINQAESRAHRIGQQNTVAVRYLLAKGTSDDYIWPLLQTKQDVLNEVGLSRDTFKDAQVSDQIVCINSDIKTKFKPAVTPVKTKYISEYFTSNNGDCDMDSTLKEFLEEDDDFLLNADLNI